MPLMIGSPARPERRMPSRARRTVLQAARISCGERTRASVPRMCRMEGTLTESTMLNDAIFSTVSMKTCSSVV